MPRLSNVHLYPYAGSPTAPWAVGRPPAPPYDDAAHDFDAAARTARRVAEGIGRRLLLAGVESKRGSYRIMMRHLAEADAVYVDPSIAFARDGFLGSIQPAAGFRLLLPEQRAEVLTRAVEECLRPLADREGWRAQLEGAVSELRDADFACAWASIWKSTRDRKLKVRLAAELADDGYGRWWIDIADSQGEHLRSTERMFGWVSIENFERMAKWMTFDAPRTLVVPSGSAALDVTTRIDLDTAAVVREGQEASADDKVLSYPGEPGRSTPEIVVEVVRDKEKLKVVGRADGTSVAERV